MLNYNLNIIDPLQQEKKNSDNNPYIYWNFHSFTTSSDSSDINERSFATMSIFAPNTNCSNVTVDSGDVFSTQPQYVTKYQLTGSNWAVTGSTTMSLYIVGISFNETDADISYYTAVSASAAAGNINSISGSILTASISASEFYNFFTSGSLIHWKGNQYNPLVNWKASNKSPVTTTGNINGYTASFNIVKDVNVPLVNLNEVTASISSSFPYQYNFGVTASLTASINNVTGSTTMSIEIPQTGVSSSQQWLNINTTTAIITGSFVATNNNPYNITASVTFNKGNINNPLVNVIATGSVPNQWNGTSGSKTTLNIVKDKNVPISMSIGYITGSEVSSFNYEYNFGVTASLTASANWILSSSFIYPTMSLLITGSGFSQSITSYSTSSIITASFAATNNNPYTIKAIVSPRYIQAFSASLLLIGGGGASTRGQNYKASGGGGGGAVYTGSFAIVPNKTYSISVGDGGKGYFDGSTTTFAGAGTASYFAGYINFDSSAEAAQTYLIVTASGGQSGSLEGDGGKSGFITASYGAASIINIPSTAGNVATSTGGAGGAGFRNAGSGSTTAAGGDGGAGALLDINQYAVPYTPFYNRLGAGGGGGGNFDSGLPNTPGGQGGTYGGGNGGGATTGRNGISGLPNTGGGAGGASSINPGISQNNYGGNGGSGVATLKYKGAPKLTGQTGSFSYDGSYTSHTWTTGSYTFSYAVEPSENPTLV